MEPRKPEEKEKKLQVDVRKLEEEEVPLQEFPLRGPGDAKAAQTWHLVGDGEEQVSVCGSQREPSLVMCEEVEAD